MEDITSTYYFSYSAASYDSCSDCGGLCDSKCYDGGSSSAVVGMTCTSNYCASGCSGPGLICGGTSRSGVPTGCTGTCGITCSTGCYSGSNCNGLATIFIQYQIKMYTIL